IEYDPRLKALAEHPGILSLLTRLMGEPPVLFQDMALIKPPRIGREKPWHQDCAYFDIPIDTTVAGVWFALDEATPENGCLHIIPESHKEGPRLHFRRRDWQICDTDVPVARDVMVPLQPGGCLIWHGLTHHGSPTNHSDKGRRALQFHYKPQSCGTIPKDERLSIYGGEMQGAEC
ncbi:MAG: phytanoyl-CoA dioxygenase family protein, partial [bacterium]|nr:phytanoyl-CoA dioxygenase family protein [bacterium]